MQSSRSSIKDPMCGMAVDAVDSINVDRNGKTYYFCSLPCREKFLAETPTESAGSASLVAVAPTAEKPFV